MPFDERATSGYGRGEGVASIILKPLEEALRDGDTVRAVIRNSGSNQDGKTLGITMPNRDAQLSLIRSVYKSARLDPLDTGFIEAHGTGTAIGDPIEASAIGEVFRRPISKTPLYIGSLKGNIGHLEGTSGIASMIKTVVMLEKGFILPNCDFKVMNPEIPMADWNMKVESSLDFGCLPVPALNKARFRAQSDVLANMPQGSVKANILAAIKDQTSFGEQLWVWRNQRACYLRASPAKKSR